MEAVKRKDSEIINHFKNLLGRAPVLEDQYTDDDLPAVYPSLKWSTIFALVEKTTFKNKKPVSLLSITLNIKPI